MKQSAHEFISEKKRLIAATTLVGLGFGALQGCNEPSPNDTINRVEAIYDNSGVDPQDCYNGVMNEGGVRADLLDELTHNAKLDMASLHGTARAASSINDALEAMHVIANDQLELDKTDAVQLGDNYQYCIDEDGKVIPGDPINYGVVTPR